MKLAPLVTVLVLSVSVLDAQTPPPPRPAPVVIPAPRPYPVIAPRPMIGPIFDYQFEYQLRNQLDHALRLQDDMILRAGDLALRQDDIRQRAEDMAYRASARAVEAATMMQDRLAMAPLPHMAGAFDLDDEHFTHRPPAPWAQGDPADSLYRVAGEAFNRGEWRRAAEVYSQLREKFPTSLYAPDCTYYQAFSLYKIGTTDDLRAGLRLLDQLLSATTPSAAGGSNVSSAAVAS